MVKIYILGGSGSGKTTLARHIASLLHIPLYDLDAIGLKKGKVTDEDAFAIAAEAAWVAFFFRFFIYLPTLFFTPYRYAAL